MAVKASSRRHASSATTKLPVASFLLHRYTGWSHALANDLLRSFKDHDKDTSTVKRHVVSASQPKADCGGRREAG